MPGGDHHALPSEPCRLGQGGPHRVRHQLAGEHLGIGDPADRRRNAITLTDEGRRHLKRLDALIADAQAEFLAPCQRPTGRNSPASSHSSSGITQGPDKHPAILPLSYPRETWREFLTSVRSN
jgi:hypothetical protein